jgi:hypothetical protein
VQCEVAAIRGERGAGVPYDRQAVGDKTSEIKIMGASSNPVSKCETEATPLCGGK